jgi:hypothetical protein
LSVEVCEPHWEMMSQLMFLNPSIFYEELHKFGRQVSPNFRARPCLTCLVGSFIGAKDVDILPYDCLWYVELDAISDAIGYAQLRRRFGIPCVLAILPWPRLRHAQAREEEAETL